MTTAKIDYRRIITSHGWKKARQIVMAACPSCSICGESPAIDVHHITPIQTGKTHAERLTLAMSPANLIPVCRRCHARLHRELKSKSPIIKSSSC